MKHTRQRQPVRWEDRRSETRLKATGSVALRLTGDEYLVFEARLMDISPSGFRARHANSALRSGQEVEFSLPSAQGLAKVVWNRTTPDFIESGFFILPVDSL
ncbi:MAG: PilZ domain-containing protein [Acidobacteriota bacterium]